MLEARGLVKRYGGLAAVNGVSLCVGPGEMVGLLGPNGAGKTTTVSMVAGLLEPDEGEVLIEGRRLQGDTDPLKRRIGLVPQEPAIVEELSAVENLLFFAASRATEAGMVQGILAGHAMEAVSREVFSGPTGRAAASDALEGLDEAEGLSEAEKGALRELLGGVTRWNDLAAAGGGAAAQPGLCAAARDGCHPRGGGGGPVPVGRVVHGGYSFRGRTIASGESSRSSSSRDNSPFWSTRSYTPRPVASASCASSVLVSYPRIGLSAVTTPMLRWTCSRQRSTFATMPVTQRSRRVSIPFLSISIDSSRLWTITGSITFSSSCPASAARVTVRSLPMTL